MGAVIPGGTFPLPSWPHGRQMTWEGYGPRPLSQWDLDDIAAEERRLSLLRRLIACEQHPSGWSRPAMQEAS